MFGRGKKEVEKSVMPPKSNVLDVSVADPNKPKVEEKAVDALSVAAALKDFATDYQGLFNVDQAANLTAATRDVTLFQLLFSIYAEMRATRLILEELIKEDGMD